MICVSSKSFYNKKFFKKKYIVIKYKSNLSSNFFNYILFLSNIIWHRKFTFIVPASKVGKNHNNLQEKKRVVLQLPHFSPFLIISRNQTFLYRCCDKYELGNAIIDKNKGKDDQETCIINLLG